MRKEAMVRAKIEQFHDRAYMAALGILRDPDAAADAVQEASVRTLQAKDRYNPEAPFYPWFYRILKNYCLDVLARRRRRPQVSDPAAVLDRLPGRSRTDAALFAKERDAAVHRAMASLSEAHREILELRHWQELSYEEIAQILDVPIGTVMSRLYRARKALLKRLKSDPAWSM